MNPFEEAGLMLESYGNAAALQSAVFEAFRFYGLEASLADVRRSRPLQADTFDQHLRRVNLSVAILKQVRSSAPVRGSDRDVICRLVEWACQRLEAFEGNAGDDRHGAPAASKTNPLEPQGNGKPAPFTPGARTPARQIRSSRWPASGTKNNERKHQ